MNVLLFLTPKKDVAYLQDNFSIRQALEKMEYHRYSAIPILNEQGKYKGTLTEGDILWYVKNKHNLSIFEAENDSILKITRRHDNLPVKATAELKDIIASAMNQNFIPVVDDNDTFIGIITRKNIFKYLEKKHLLNN